MVEYSIVIPTYNGSSKLPIVLDSLMRQSIHPSRFEVIIVNDGGAPLERSRLDELVSVYTGLRIILIHLPLNLGPAVARNCGIRRASGAVVFFTDDDCEVPALWLESHLVQYAKHPDVSSVGGWYRTPLSVLRTNLFEILITLRYETFHFLYTAKSTKDIAETSLRGFAAFNTANLSVKAYVLTSVAFDESLMSGHEDIEFARLINEKGFHSYYIPQFVRHHKILNLRSVLRMAFHRGLGVYIKDSFNVKAPRNQFGSWVRTKKYIQLTSLFVPSVRRRKYALLILNYAYCVMHSSILFWPFRAYANSRHRKNLARWRAMSSLHVITQSANLT